MPQPAPMTRQELRAALDRQPRFSLAPLPTPLQEAPNLSRALGGPRILVKRDDLTGLGFGGNKVRHMEFVVGHVRDRGADVWVNINLPMRYPSLSNNARISGSAARKGGLRYVCVVPGGGNKHMDANRLLLDLMGAELHLIDTEETEEVHAYTNELANRLRGEGHTPFVQPFEPRVRPSGVMGYVNAAMEIEGQLDALGIREATIWMPAGGSHGGITLATKALGLPWQVTGVIYSDRATYFADVLGWTNSAAELLGLPLSLEQKDLVQLEGYVGDGYSAVTPEAVEAVRLMAEQEGTILEPLHTGKALAALVDHIRRGGFTSAETVVFVHTGGLPELFGFADEMTRR